MMLWGALISIAIGGLMVVSAVLPSSSSAEIAIPEGNYHYWMQTTSLYNGKVSGTFQVVSGSNITVIVLNETEYEDVYSVTGLYTELSIVSGMNGSFSASQQGVGRLFIVFEHEHDDAITNVTVTIRVSGTSVTSLTIGVLFIAATIAFVFLWRRALAKESIAKPRRDEDSGRVQNKPKT